MSLQLKKSNKLKYLGITGAVVLGSTVLILNTFPHLKTKIYNYVRGIEEEEGDNEPVVSESNGISQPETVEEPRDIAEESIVDIKEWSTEDLKSWLKQKEISPPEDSNHSNLVSLVQSIKEST